MEPKEILKKAKELAEAYEKLGIAGTDHELIVLRVFVEATFPRVTVRLFPTD